MMPPRGPVGLEGLLIFVYYSILGDIRLWVGPLEESSSLLVRPHLSTLAPYIHTTRGYSSTHFKPRSSTSPPVFQTPKPQPSTIPGRHFDLYDGPPRPGRTTYWSESTLSS